MKIPRLFSLFLLIMLFAFYSLPSAKIQAVPIEPSVMSPPHNPYTPNSSWPEGHNVYVQHSTDEGALAAGDIIVPNIVRFEGGNDSGFSPSGTMLSEPDSQGNYFFFSTNGKLAYKAAVSGKKVSLQVTDGKQTGYETISGYWCMDNNNIIYVLNQKKYGNQEIISLNAENHNGFNSGLQVLSRFPVPDGFVQEGRNKVYETHGLKEIIKGKVLFEHDELAGIKILYSGELVVTTRYGKVMIVDREFKHHYIMDLEDPIFKNIAVEEDGSIYIVSYRYLWRLLWNHNELQVAWKVAVPGQSGSTPALMGVSPDDDRLVAITLNNQPAEIWLFWRHDIPAGWQGIPSLDRRVAARVSVTYGGDSSKSFSSLNSLLVSGYGVLAVNWTGMMPRIQAKRSGIARYDWNPKSRTLELTWNNPNVWLPNSMQALSRKTRLFYALGVKEAPFTKQYGLYGINWSDGGIAFFVPCGSLWDQSLNIEGSGIQIGPNREIITMSPWALIMFQAAADFYDFQNPNRPQTAERNPDIKMKSNPAVQSKTGLPAPSGLMCDYMPRPDKALVTNPHPVFSWIFNTNRPNQNQYAYRVLVASSEEEINRNRGDFWDAGQVVSDESVCVPYGGKPLESQKSYWWKVQVWSAPEEAGEWSRAQHFTTGDYSYQRKWPYESRLIKAEEEDGIGYYCFENRAPLIYHEKHPVKIVKRPDGSCFVDFGKSAFATLKIRHGKLASPQVRVCIGEKCKGDAVDRKPGGSLTYLEKTFEIDPSRGESILDLPRFVPRYPHSLSLPDFMKDVKPFRYCEIFGLTKELQTEDIAQLALYLDFNEEDASFHSSDANLNAVYDLCKYSIMVNTFNGDYASSERERMMYEADTYIHQMGHYATERQYATARYSGLFQLYHASWPTEWIYHAIFIAHADYLITHDKAFLSNAYHDLKCKLMLPMADENLLVSTTNKLQTKEFLASIYYNQEKLKDIVDWPPADFSGGKYGERDNFVFTDYNSVVNAFYYKSLLLMKEIAEVAGKNEDAAFYAQLASRFKQVFNQTFFDSKRRIYLDGVNTDHASLHANLFALAFGLVEPAHVKNVVEYIKSRGMACSVYAAQYLLEGLYDAGEAQYALELMTATHDRSWMNMLYAGSTITTEAWDLKYKGNGSWTHAWSTSPVHVIPRKLVGIEPLEPGFKTIRIFPQIGSLEKVSMKYPTPRGTVAVDIFQREDEYSIKLTIPGNSTALVYVPIRKQGKVEINDEENVSRMPDTKTGYFIYRVGSGTYQFLSR